MDFVLESVCLSLLLPGGICVRGVAVVLCQIPRQPEMSGSDRGKPSQCVFSS